MNPHIKQRTVKSINRLLHKTQPESALFIAINGVFNSCKGEYYRRSGNNTKDPYNIDHGMNFLGARGEVANHQIENRGAQLICDWNGAVSNPLKCEQLVPLDEQDVLYDVGGSDPNSNEIDPKYVLPNGSSCGEKHKLLLRKVEFIESKINSVPISKEINEIAAWLIIWDQWDKNMNRENFSLCDIYKIKRLRKIFPADVSSNEKIEELATTLSRNKKFYETLERWVKEKTNKLNNELATNPKQIKLIPEDVPYLP